MAAYIAKNCDMLKKVKLSNISTGAQLSDDTNHFLLNCFETGESIHQKYRKERLEDRSVALFDAIKDPHKKGKNNKSDTVKPDLDKIKLGFLRRMEIARTHCINIKSLLRYELIENSFFLSPVFYLNQRRQTCNHF